MASAAITAPVAPSINLLLAAVTVTIFAMILLVIAMLDHRFAIHVTFDAARGGYIATHPQLAAPVIALNLAVLRARVGRQLDIAAVNVRLKLDRAARMQRDARRRGGVERGSDTSAQNAAG